MRPAAIPFTIVFAIPFAFAFAGPAGDREAARFVLEKHCGNCHREDSPKAVAKALSVFNLNLPDFAATMTKAQLENASGRLKNLRPAATDDAKAVKDEFGVFGGTVTADELKTYDAFVRAELQRRANRPKQH